MPKTSYEHIGVRETGAAVALEKMYGTPMSLHRIDNALRRWKDSYTFSASVIGENMSDLEKGSLLLEKRNLIIFVVSVPGTGTAAVNVKCSRYSELYYFEAYS